MSEVAYDELLRRLAEVEAKFVLIGGLALNAWGVVRGTKDVDIVVAREAENLRRVAKAAVAAGGHVQRAESLTSSEPGIAALLASGEQVMIETRFGKLDVVGGLDSIPPYEELAKRAVETEVLGVEVQVCSVDDLRARNKARLLRSGRARSSHPEISRPPSRVRGRLAAGRKRDLVDLEDLEASEG